jgi:hypothetical protein
MADVLMRDLGQSELDEHRAELELLAAQIEEILLRGTIPRPAPFWRGFGAKPLHEPLAPAERRRLESLLEQVRAELITGS